MPEDNQQESALDSPVGRLTARVTQISQIRPSAPTEFRADSTSSTLRWDTPGTDVVFTHYRLRIDHDDGVPDMEFPSGTRLVYMAFGSRFALTAYNKTSDLESNPVYVEHTFTGASGGSGGDCSCGSGFTHVEEQTFTADATVPNTSYTPCTGDMLTWKLKFTGGPWAVTGWGTQYKNAPTLDINGAPSTLTVVTFFGSADSGGTARWFFQSLSTGLSSY